MTIPTRLTVDGVHFKGYLSTIKPNLALMQYRKKSFERVILQDLRRASFLIRDCAKHQTDFNSMTAVVKVLKYNDCAMLLEFVDDCTWFEERGYRTRWLQQRGTLAEFMAAHQGGRLGAPLTVSREYERG